MNWEKLKIFYYVARYKSFSAAGEKRNISHSSISKIIGQLEHELKYRVFHRHHKGIILTDAGEILYKAAKEIFESLESTKNVLDYDRKKMEGTIRFQSTQGLISYWLFEDLINFKRKYPDIQLLMIGSEHQPDLELGQFEVAIRPYLTNRPDLVQELLAEHSLNLYGSEEYLRINGAPKKEEDLNDHKLLAYGGLSQNLFGDNDWHLKVGMPTGAVREPVLSSNSSFNLFKAAQAGLGLVVLPSGYPALKGSKLRRVLSEIGPLSKSYCIYPESLKTFERVKVFVKFLKTSYKKFQVN